MPGRKFSGGNSYRYGFNGQEKSTEINGSENLYTAEYWEYDSRIVRRWNVDPVPEVSISPYNCFGGNPIWRFDVMGDTPTVHQAAQMSNDSYNKFIDRKKIDGGWSRLESFGNVKFEDKRTDFQGALYSRTVNGKTEYTFATAGTASGKDAWQDVIQAFGKSGQYSFSIQQAEALKGLLAGQELTFTGHSLGGGTAAANALYTGGVAITFNAAGTSLLTKNSLKLNQKASIQAFIIPGEAIDYYQGKVGSTADGKQIFVHPSFGQMGATFAYIIKQSSQTVFIRGEHHMMSSMYQALTKAGYGEGGDGERVVPIIMIKLPVMKLPQDADNTINRQLPKYSKTYGEPKQ